MTTTIETVNWRAVEDRGCTRKTPFGETTARVIANQRDDLRAYPCCWSGDHWHVGHPLTISGMETLAIALRAREIELGHNHHRDVPHG